MQRNREDNDTQQVEENIVENMEKSAELGNIKKDYKQLLETKRTNYITEESTKLNSWLNQKQDNKIWDYIKP